MRYGSAPNGSPQVTPAGGSYEGGLQLVLFQLVGRGLGFPLMNVSEILPMVSITKVPESTRWLPGVINLRGRTLPVMDLRERLGLPPRELDPDAAIIVVEPWTRDPVGVIVDRVLDVVTLSEDGIFPVDPLSGDEHPVDALGRDGEQVIPIIGVDRLVAGTLDLALPEELE